GGGARLKSGEGPAMLATPEREPLKRRKTVPTREASGHSGWAPWASWAPEHCSIPAGVARVPGGSSTRTARSAAGGERAAMRGVGGGRVEVGDEGVGAGEDVEVEGG